MLREKLRRSIRAQALYDRRKGFSMLYKTLNDSCRDINHLILDSGSYFGVILIKGHLGTRLWSSVNGFYPHYESLKPKYIYIFFDWVHRRWWSPTTLARRTALSRLEHWNCWVRIPVVAWMCAVILCSNCPVWRANPPPKESCQMSIIRIQEKRPRTL